MLLEKSSTVKTKQQPHTWLHCTKVEWAQRLSWGANVGKKSEKGNTRTQIPYTNTPTRRTPSTRERTRHIKNCNRKIRMKLVQRSSSAVTASLSDGSGRCVMRNPPSTGRTWTPGCCWRRLGFETGHPSLSVGRCFQRGCCCPLPLADGAGNTSWKATTTTSFHRPVYIPSAWRHCLRSSKEILVGSATGFCIVVAAAVVAVAAAAAVAAVSS